MTFLHVFYVVCSFLQYIKRWALLNINIHFPIKCLMRTVSLYIGDQINWYRTLLTKSDIIWGPTAQLLRFSMPCSSVFLLWSHTKLLENSEIHWRPEICYFGHWINTYTIDKTIFKYFKICTSMFLPATGGKKMPTEFLCFVSITLLCKKHWYLIFFNSCSRGQYHRKKASKIQAFHINNARGFYRVGVGLGPSWFSEPSPGVTPQKK